MQGDELDWIFESAGTSQLADRYDRWAASYDDDHEAWGWLGPQMAAGRFVAHQELPGRVLDAGCGTGAAGVALRGAGFVDPLVGVDLSVAMIERAATLDAYRQLTLGSVTDLPFPDRSMAGLVSTGVFTHGHVGGAGFAELCRVVSSGGAITITQRCDVLGDNMRFADRLVEVGVWSLVEVTEPTLFHPGRDDSLQSVVTWRVS